MDSTAVLVAFWISPRICRTWRGRLLRLVGQRLDLAGDHGEAPAVLAGPRGLDGGVQGQQVGLLGDVVDRGDDLADGLGLLGQRQDVLGGRLDLLLDRVHGGQGVLDGLAAGLADLQGALHGLADASWLAGRPGRRSA